MKSYGVTIQMKATEHYFPVVLFIMLYKGIWEWVCGWITSTENMSIPIETILQHNLKAFFYFSLV